TRNQLLLLFAHLYPTASYTLSLHDALPIFSVKYVHAKTGGTSSDSSLAEAAATVRPGQKSRGVKGSAADSGRRKYLGYVIQLYYDDELQAVQAEPSRLLQLFPPSKSTSAR